MNPIKRLKIWWKWRRHSDGCDVEPETLTWNKDIKERLESRWDGNERISKAHICSQCYWRINNRPPEHPNCRSLVVGENEVRRTDEDHAGIS